MGFFLLRKDDERPDALAGLTRAAGRHGFPHRRQLRLDSHRLDLFGNLSGSDPQMVELEGGDFVVSCGFLLYRDLAGEAALRAFHRDFVAAEFDWHGLVGLNVLLLRKDGRLHLLNDALGACKIFHNDDFSLVSNSFIALAWLGCGRAFELQGCFEYVFAGSCYGKRTLLAGISTLPANQTLSLDGVTLKPDQRPSPISQRDWPPEVSLDEVARDHAARIDRLMEPIVAHFGDRLRLSTSGGYDSRLALASLLKLGARPTLFTYGQEGEQDVRIARQIAETEGLDFERIDKSRVAPPPPEDFADAAERDLFAFDGWKSDEGIFSNGADRTDRLKRHDRGQIPINGSLGEIYRNFFYLSDRPLTALDLVSTFYAQYDPSSGGTLFDERAYRGALAQSIIEAVGAESHRLERWQAELAYPLFRGRYWTGHDGQINQRFGPMLFPYLEQALISDTARIPIALKDMGRLQGRMIELQNPKVAAYPSSYGYPLAARPPVKERLLYVLNCRRPMALRRLAFRVKHRRFEARSEILSPAYLSRLLDPALPHTSKLFRTERMASASQYNRVLTLEYLATTLGLDPP